MTISIETYFRCLSTERASAYNIYHPTLYESSLQILENIIRYFTYLILRFFLRIFKILATIPFPHQRVNEVNKPLASQILSDEYSVAL